MPNVYKHRVIPAGTKFGKLTVIGEGRSVRYLDHFIHHTLCRCECGKVLEIRNCNLKHQIGCRSCAMKVHGESNREKTRLYRIWLNMNNRCRNPNYIQPHLYVERGITVCDEWRTSYIVFRDWAMSHGYADSLSIDRIDNDKGYSPDNCRWADKYVQRRNQRNTIVKVLYKGKLTPLMDIVAETGIPRRKLYRRIHDGWNADDAINVPWHKHRKLIHH